MSSGFNAIFYRKGMASEVAKAAVYAELYPETQIFGMDKTNVIVQEIVDAIHAGPILVLGSYYDCPSIAALQKKGGVTIFFYGEEDSNKYAGQRISVAKEMFTPEEEERHPWLRRTISRFKGTATPDDEAFLRGVLQQRTTEEIRSGSMIDVFVRLVKGAYDEKTLIAEGFATANAYAQMATSIDATSACTVLIAGQKARFAITASEPVMPIVEELAKGEGIGIVMRYSFANGALHPVTMITAFSLAPEHLDLNFINRLGGGGSEKCKGKTLDGFYIPVFRTTEKGPPELSFVSFGPILN